jgi:hypothetical protein
MILKLQGNHCLALHAHPSNLYEDKCGKYRSALDVWSTQPYLRIMVYLGRIGDVVVKGQVFYN